MPEPFTPSDGSLQTPCYLIDESRLRRNLQIAAHIRELSGAKLVLALKCFSAWSVFDLMRQYLDGTTSSSLYEARLGRERFGKEVHAYSVAWAPHEITQVARIADKLIFNSASQLRAHHGALAGHTLGVRVNPGISHSRYSLADPACRHSRLGIVDDDELRSVAGLISGVMFHFNCENESLDSLQAALAQISARYGDVLSTLAWVSLGGGISFTHEGYPIEAFCRVLRDFSQGHQVQIYLEPGEALVRHTTELVTTVLDVVHNERPIAIVDASVEAHMLDHLIYRTHPQISDPEPGPHRMIVAGRTCLAGDHFGEHGFKNPLKTGQKVRISDAGGYTMVKKNWFNGVAMPAIAVQRLDGRVETIREFSYQDYESSLS